MAPKLEGDNQQMKVVTGQYAEVLGRVADADTRLSLGAQEFQRGAFSESHHWSVEAVKALRGALRALRLSEDADHQHADIDWDLCRRRTPAAATALQGPDAAGPNIEFVLQRASAAATAAQAPDATGPNVEFVLQRASAAAIAPQAPDGDGSRPLQHALLTVLYNAVELRTRSLYFSAGRNIDNLYEDAITLVSLNADRQEGYHWLGLAESEYAIRRASKKLYRDHAITCLNRSIEIRPDENKDLINLAELQFVSEHYPEAAESIRRFLKWDSGTPTTIPKHFESPLDVSAYFYLLAAEVQLHIHEQPAREVDNQHVKDFMETLALQRMSLATTFQFATIDDYIKVQKIPKEDPIAMMCRCLRDGHCNWPAARS